MKNVILITGASSGIGALTARALAQAGHSVYATMRDIKGRSVEAVQEANQFAADTAADLRVLEMDVTDAGSVDAAVQQVLHEAGRLDVIVHNAGHMVFGPAEAFTPEQLAEIYDVNVLGTQRLNRAALPCLRKQRSGLVVWIGSSSTRGGTPPYLAPYFAAKAGMDALAVSYALELSRWGIETTIIVPGAYTSGTNHFAHAGSPEDKAVLAEYDDGPYAHLTDDLQKGFAATLDPNADVSEVANAVVQVVDTPFGQRPLRVHIATEPDGAEVVNAVADHIRAEFVRSMRLGDLLRPVPTP